MTSVGSVTEAPANQPTQTSGRYHPALDGLRAVAVMVVLLYHGGSSWFPGGFLGVDMFFVLSGFLITGLLLAEWEKHSRLDLKNFWLRRARRLLPALLTMIFVTVIVVAIVGSPIAGSIRADGLASLFYVSNWWFILDNTSYATGFVNPSPFLHTWSLAIEEQWYLLLPLALVLVLPRGLPRRALAVVLVVLALTSAAWMFAIAPEGVADASRVYFGTDTRIQALLVGSALACVAPFLGRSRAMATAAVGGALLLLAAVVTVSFSDSRLYRGGFLLVAVAVAAVIADVTARPQGLLARMLSIPPMVAIGKISYGLYLWHWPVYIFLNDERTGLSGYPLLILRLAVTFAISTASYHLIEMPIRRGALGRIPTGTRLALVIGSVAVVVAGLLALPRVATASNSPSIGDLAAQQSEQAPMTADAPTVALLGDSQVLALQQQQPPDMTGLSIIPVTEFGCGLIPYEADIDGQRMSLLDQCAGWGEGRYREILEQSDAQVGVLLAGTWEQYDRWTPEGAITYRDPRWSTMLTDAYSQRLEALAATTDEVVLVLNHCHSVPEWDLPLDQQFQAGRYPPVINDPDRIAAVNKAAVAAAESQPFPVKVIDLNPLLCPNGYTEELDGVDLRTDGLHFSEGGARIVWEYLQPRLERLADRD